MKKRGKEDEIKRLKEADPEEKMIERGRRNRKRKKEGIRRKR